MRAKDFIPLGTVPYEVIVGWLRLSTPGPNSYQLDLSIFSLTEFQ